MLLSYLIGFMKIINHGNSINHRFEMHFMSFDEVNTKRASALDIWLVPSAAAELTEMEDPPYQTMEIGDRLDLLWRVIVFAACLACAAAKPGVLAPTTFAAAPAAAAAVAYANAPLYAAAGSSQIDVRHNFDGSLSSYTTAPFAYTAPYSSRYVAAPAAYAASTAFAAPARVSAPAAFSSPAAFAHPSAFAAPAAFAAAAPKLVGQYASPFASAYAAPYAAPYAAYSTGFADPAFGAHGHILA
ncbi:uncharacterized protein LOC106089048 [Stomoxys calcitrans]|uniref:uncharacterized protein LOC106089048 n=1 Tax=Stomoxys calcitrans TaxID=35570 RepID=UPI0027E2F50E|nr:uncharacterized protein LOC106089048 [Stomoxys calcitrans]